MFKAFIRLFVTLGGLSLGLAASVAAQAQTMSTSQVERILDGMMGQPVSLFLGVPMAYDKLWAMDLDGSGSSFDVTLVGANLLGQDLGDLQLQAEVSGDARLDLRLDLSALFEGLAAMNQTVASVGTLRIDARLDTERGGYERFQLVVDDLFAADGSNPEDDFLRVDGAIFTYDESEQSPLVTLDFGLDGIRFSEGGKEQFTFETLGASFELINLPDWLLHVEANKAVQQFFMAQAGLMPPTLAAANVLESLAPLFEEDLIDLASSVEIGEITMNDVYVEGANADIAFGGLAFGTSFDAASGLGLSAGDIGSLTIDLSSSWDEEAEPYRLLNFEGARFDAETLYSDGYSLRPLGAILRDVAAEVRSLSPEDLAQPEALITDLYFNHVSTLVDWALSSVQSSTTDFATGALALVNQDEWEPLSLVMDSLYYNSDLEVDAASGSDRQSLTVGLAGLVLEGPEDITVKAGDLNLTYGLNNALSVIREVLGSLEDSTLSMGDAIRLGFAVYLPDLVMTARDLNLEVSSPLDGGALSIDLAALDFGLMTDGMNSDAGTLSLVFEQDGLAVSLDDQSLDPRLLDLVLGGQDVGLLPTTIAMQVDLADIPMATLLTIAESVMLPPIEVMAEPGFDPSSLAFGAVALLSPLLSSPPSIVVQPSEISGGLVGVTAEGRVQISPLTEPNRALGSITLRVKGVNELSARAGRLMAELSGDQSAAAVQSMELLQGLMGFAMMAGGFGAPSDDGALEFVIDIPAGAPANINGLPIPLPF